MLLGVAMLSTPAIASVVAGVLAMSSISLPSIAAPAATATTAVTSTALASTGAAPITSTSTAGGTGTGTSTAAGTGTAPVAIPEPFIGPDPIGGGSSLELLARLSGVALLDELARLTPTEVGSFIAAHPTLFSDLAANPPAAADVAEWWSRMPSPARSLLAADLPTVLGGLEGVPYAVRDAANRTVLARTAADIRAQLDAGVGRAMEDELQSRLVMLTAIERALEPGPSRAPRSLVALDVTGEGRAVIAIGRLDRADYVTFFVPGMYVGVAQQLVDWAGNAETSLLEQRTWLRETGVDAEVATVAWIGYHTPTVVSIGSLDLAYQGRDALTGSLRGLDAVRDVAGLRSGDADRAPFVTVVAHSYGSTAAMMSLQGDVAVDALVMVGSPGGPAPTVGDLRVANGNVWVAAADSDPIPRTGVYGNQPLDAEFGAHRFSVRAATDPITGEHLADISGHVYYFWPGTTSVRNTALIAIDRGDLVITDAPAPGPEPGRVARASAAR